MVGAVEREYDVGEQEVEGCSDSSGYRDDFENGKEAHGVVGGDVVNTIESARVVSQVAFGSQRFYRAR